MQTTLFAPAIPASYSGSIRNSFLQQFLQWSTAQDKHRFLWLAIIVIGHGGMLAPLSSLVVLATGHSFYLIAVPVVAMAASLVSNLAALPTKYTIPVFAMSILADLALVATCLATAS